MTALASRQAGTTAIVLAGGRSSRMGRDKAWLPIDGQPLVVRVVNLLDALFDEVVVVAARGQRLPPVRARIARDAVPGEGPARGLQEGLLRASGDVAFATACDAAFLEPSLVRYLLSRIPGHDVVVPCWRGRWQPLHAVYRVSVLPVLSALLAEGERRPAALFDKVRTCRVEAEDVRRFDPDGSSFWNVNTPADYANALVRCQVGGRQQAAGSMQLAADHA